MTEEKKELILSHERTYTASLSKQMITKPKLSSLMIFIPFLFIFYIQDLLKYKKGLNGFNKNYLSSREKALNEAVESVENDRKINTADMGTQAGLEEKAATHYSAYLNILATHYALLLKGNGEDYESLARSAYQNNKKRYKSFTDSLSDAESLLNRSLIEKETGDSDDVKETIRNLEKINRDLRREELKTIFS